MDIFDEPGKHGGSLALQTALSAVTTAKLAVAGLTRPSELVQQRLRPALLEAENALAALEAVIARTATEGQAARAQKRGREPQCRLAPPSGPRAGSLARRDADGSVTPERQAAPSLPSASADCAVCLLKLGEPSIARSDGALGNPVFAMPCCGVSVHLECVRMLAGMRCSRQRCPTCQSEVSDDMRDELDEADRRTAKSSRLLAAAVRHGIDAL